MSKPVSNKLTLKNTQCKQTYCSIKRVCVQNFVHPSRCMRNFVHVVLGDVIQSTLRLSLFTGLLFFFGYLALFGFLFCFFSQFYTYSRPARLSCSQRWSDAALYIMQSAFSMATNTQLVGGQCGLIITLLLLK